MKIDRKRLNLIVPIDREDGKTLYVHIAPLSEEVFSQHFMLIGQTFNAFYADELGVGAPRLAAMLLKKIATEQRIWPQTEAGLVAEMHRGATVLAPDANGAYQQFLWDEASTHDVLSADDRREVDGVIVYFTVVSCMGTREALNRFIAGLIGTLQAQASSSAPMEFANSLKTSTEAVSMPEKAIRSSIPG